MSELKKFQEQYSYQLANKCIVSVEINELQVLIEYVESLEQERDSFEAWYIAGVRKAVPAFAEWSDSEIREGCMRPENDSYRIDSTRIALEAWQARAALADTSAPLEKLRVNPESEPVAKYVYGEKTVLLDVVAPSLALESTKKQLAMSQVVLPEPEAYLFQHEETGRTMFVDTQQVEWGFEANNPRLQKISGVYTEQQVRQLLGAQHGST